LLVLCFFGVGISAKCINPIDLTSTLGFKPDQNKAERGRANYYEACGSPKEFKTYLEEGGGNTFVTTHTWQCNFEKQYIVPANKILVIESINYRSFHKSRLWSAITLYDGVFSLFGVSGPQVYQSGDVLSLKMVRRVSPWQMTPPWQKPKAGETTYEADTINAQLSKDGIYDMKIIGRLFDKAAYNRGSQCY